MAGALAAAAERGAFTALLTCNPGSPLQPLARAVLAAETGPEAIAGSTRLKATSALKLILNSFSTALMIRLGKTYSNLMVEVRAVNSKLRSRTLRILSDASGARRGGLRGRAGPGRRRPAGGHGHAARRRGRARPRSRR